MFQNLIKSLCGLRASARALTTKRKFANVFTQPFNCDTRKTAFTFILPRKFTVAVWQDHACAPHFPSDMPLLASDCCDKDTL